MYTNALDAEQRKRLANVTNDMLTLIESDEEYFAVLKLLSQLPPSLVNEFAQLGLMYLATERAKRFVASTN